MIGYVMRTCTLASRVSVKSRRECLRVPVSVRRVARLSEQTFVLWIRSIASVHASGLPAVFWKQYSDSVSRRLCFGSGVLPVCMQVACLLYFGSSIQGMIVVIICHLFSMSFVAVRTPVFGVNVIESGVAAWRGMDWMLVVIVLLFKLLSQFWCVGLCIAGVWNGVVLEWSWSPSITSS